MSLEEERSWMYSGWSDSGRHSEEWIRNTNGFVNHVFEGVRSAKFGVCCPCSKCSNSTRRTKTLMCSHLCQWGFMPGYLRWTSHGERIVSVSRNETINTASSLEDMLCDFGDSVHVDNVEGVPTPDAKAFYAMLSAVQDPLHNFTKVSRFTIVTQLMGIKSQYNLSGECINSILKMLLDALPESHKMSSTLYECKCLLRGLKMPYIKIDACTNHCMLYYKEDENKQKCDFCGETRYKVVPNDETQRKRKPIPRAVLRYLPLIPRLQRIFMEPETAKHMRWHKEGERANPGVMVRPSDSESWKSFNEEDFANDPRNVRVAMCTDGFNPFGFIGDLQKKAKEFHGVAFDWEKNPVSARALYHCSDGKPHGRWALFNGVVNDTDVIAEVREGVTSSTAFKRRRSEKMEDELRRACEKSRKADAYAKNVLSWGLGMYNHCNGIHKFLETLATNQGVPFNEIPPPPVPPPARSPSPCRSRHSSPIHNLDTNQDPPALCAEEHANHPYVHENVVSSNVSAQDINLEPVACAEGMFGGFFSETGTGTLSLSLLGSQQPTS